MKLDRKTLLGLGSGIFILFLLIYYWANLNGLLLGLLSAVSPLLVGFFMAYIVNILMGFYERHYFPRQQTGAAAKSRRAVCLILAFLSLLLIIVGVAVLIVPALSESIQLLGKGIPVVWEEIVSWIHNNVTQQQWVSLEAMVGDLSTDVDWQEVVRKGGDWLMNGFGGAMGTVAAVLSRAFSTTVTLLVGAVFAIYLLYNREKLLGQLDRVSRHYMKAKWYHRGRYLFEVLDRSFHRFIVGQCLEAVILGVLCMAGMALLRLPYATMIGTLVGVTALIPMVGAYLGALVGAILIVTVSPWQALLFLIFIVILQQVEGNLIYPRVVGASMGLPGLWVLAAITVCGSMMGVGGMILGVPLAAALYQILRDNINITPARDPALEELPEDEPEDEPENGS